MSVSSSSSSSSSSENDSRRLRTKWVSSVPIKAEDSVTSDSSEESMEDEDWGRITPKDKQLLIRRLQLIEPQDEDEISLTYREYHKGKARPRKQATSHQSFRSYISELDSPSKISSTIAYEPEIRRKLHFFLTLFWTNLFMCFFLCFIWSTYTTLITFYYIERKNSTFTNIREYAPFSALFNSGALPFYLFVTLLKFYYGEYPSIRALNQVTAFTYNSHFFLIVPIIIADIIINQQTLSDEMYSAIRTSVGVREINETFRNLQNLNHCCGVMGYNDWNKVNKSYYPDSCCEPFQRPCTQENVWKDGCYEFETRAIGLWSGFLIILEIITCVTCVTLFYIHRHIWLFAREHRTLSRFLDVVTSLRKPYSSNKADVPM